MNNTALMKRMDTKFIVNAKSIDSILNAIHSDYQILQIDSNRLMTYKSTYFDTSDSSFYTMHHNGISSRIKVRIREYVESKISFLEVKQKDNKGNTTKTRISVASSNHTIEESGNNFIANTTGQNLLLEKSISNQFNRFTLVNTGLQERVTFDFNLSFNDVLFNENLVIIELKQSRLNRSSPIFQTLKSKSIYPYKISKYCIGMASSDPNLKQNLLKPKFKQIKKLTSL